MAEGCYWLILALCVANCMTEKVHYDGYQVLRITPKNENELDALRNLQKSDLRNHVDFWKAPTRVNNPVDIMLPPDIHNDITSALGNGSIRAIIDNVQNEINREINEHIPGMGRLKGLNFNFNYNQYNTIDDIQHWVTKTAETYDAATEGSIGVSYEGRPIKYLKISSGEPKKGVLLHGGIHAREWISPATVIYLAKYLVEGSDEEGSDAANLLNQFDFYIIPVMNPDGYSYTWSNDRLWRKTRKPNRGSGCVGTDANRNFGVVWGDTSDERSSTDPCSGEYHGSAPFSEPEVAALRDFVTSLGGGSANTGIALYIDYHSYSQLWLTPYGYTVEEPKDYQQQIEGAIEATKALQSVHGTRYEAGTIYSTVYPVSGDSADYMYKVQNITYSYAVEGRDRGHFAYGFLLPANQIQASGEENWDALVALCRFVADDLCSNGDDSNGEDDNDDNIGDGSVDGNGDGGSDSGSGDGGIEIGSGDGDGESGSGDGDSDSGSGDGDSESGSGDGDSDSGSGGIVDGIGDSGADGDGAGSGDSDGNDEVAGGDSGHIVGDGGTGSSGTRRKTRKQRPTPA